MPTYEYRCKGCGHRLDAFQSINDAALTECPACNTPQLQRWITGGAGVVFKGTGFYQTDYKSAGDKSTSRDSDRDKPAAKDSGGDSGTRSGGGCGSGCACC